MNHIIILAVFHWMCMASGYSYLIKSKYLKWLSRKFYIVFKRPKTNCKKGKYLRVERSTLKKQLKTLKKQKIVENCEGLPLSIMTIWINSFKIYTHFAWFSHILLCYHAHNHSSQMSRKLAFSSLYPSITPSKTQSVFSWARSQWVLGEKLHLQMNN